MKPARNALKDAIENAYRTAVETRQGRPPAPEDEASLEAVRPKLPRIDAKAVSARVSRRSSSPGTTKGEGIVVTIPYEGERVLLETILPRGTDTKEFGRVSVRDGRIAVFHPFVLSLPTANESDFARAKDDVAGRTRALVDAVATATAQVLPVLEKQHAEFVAHSLALANHPVLVDRFEEEIASMDFGL